METWKPVLGFEGLYEVSDCGNVRRTSRGKSITAEKIPEARRMLASGSTLKQVAQFLGVSVTTVQSIKQGKTWSGDANYRPVNPRPNRTHYLIVDFCKNSQYTKKQVHRVVWEAFNGPIPGRLEVNHKNLDRSDNRLDNLELLTHRENVQHAYNIYKQERDTSSINPGGKLKGRYFTHGQ